MKGNRVSEITQLQLFECYLAMCHRVSYALPDSPRGHLPSLPHHCPHHNPPDSSEPGGEGREGGREGGRAGRRVEWWNTGLVYMWVARVGL